MKRHAHFAATESEERASSPKNWLAPEKFVGCLQLMMKVCKHVSELVISRYSCSTKGWTKGGLGNCFAGWEFNRLEVSCTQLFSDTLRCYRI